MGELPRCPVHAAKSSSSVRGCHSESRTHARTHARTRTHPWMHVRAARSLSNPPRPARTNHPLPAQTHAVRTHARAHTRRRARTEGAYGVFCARAPARTPCPKPRTAHSPPSGDRSAAAAAATATAEPPGRRPSNGEEPAAGPGSDRLACRQHARRCAPAQVARGRGPARHLHGEELADVGAAVAGVDGAQVRRRPPRRGGRHHHPGGVLDLAPNPHIQYKTVQNQRRRSKSKFII